MLFFARWRQKKRFLDDVVFLFLSAVRDEGRFGSGGAARVWANRDVLVSNEAFLLPLSEIKGSRMPSDTRYCRCLPFDLR